MVLSAIEACILALGVRVFLTSSFLMLQINDIPHLLSNKTFTIIIEIMPEAAYRSSHYGRTLTRRFPHAFISEYLDFPEISHPKPIFPFLDIRFSYY